MGRAVQGRQPLQHRAQRGEMNVREPRFLIIDLHKNKAVPATTDEMQALLWREESNKKSDMKEDSSPFHRINRGSLCIPDCLNNCR